jgi:hypothetical protein
LVKVVGAYGRQSYHLHAPVVLKYGILNRLEPSGHIQGLLELLRMNYLHGTTNHDDDDDTNKNNTIINNNFSIVGALNLKICRRVGGSRPCLHRPGSVTSNLMAILVGPHDAG